MKTKLLTAAIILIFVCSLIPPSQLVSASSYNVNYTLTLEKEDYPDITIQVNGYPDQNAVFVFLGSAANNISSLNAIFQQMEVKDFAGNNLSWQWVDKGISVANGSVKDFIIRYSIDATNFLFPGLSRDPNFSKSVLFRFKLIFFIAGDVFLTPNVEPENIIVDYSLPEGTTLYASLPSENGTFNAVRDLWGNLQRDFSLAYFAGGHALFTLNHTTEWGDEYQYIWFDRDPLEGAWSPSYGNTPWEQAERYMESTESCARYFRDTIGPLPNHRVLFTNVSEQYIGFPSAVTNQDWYHYMQIWPRNSEPETCHHVFHQYSFSPLKEQSKLVFGGDSIANMFWEGLPTYYEQILPSQLLGDPRYSGKLFEFYILDIRGIPFGIRGNTDFHKMYNISALKVYLLDQFIRTKTGGNNSLDGLIHAMWDMVKDNTAPNAISQEDVLSAFSSVVGAENVGYLNEVANMSTFDLEALEDLRTPFSAYSDWMIHEYFWDKPILFYIYLDIAAAKGDEWPHFATYPHNVLRYRTKGLQPVWDYLSAHSGNPITQKDILDAMNASTGMNHAGFFEFWESLGVKLDPNEIIDLVNWDPENRMPEDFLPHIPGVNGTLLTEHLLAGVTQQATIHLDVPAPTNKILIAYQYAEEESSISSDTIKKVIQGKNVYLQKEWTFLYENLNITSVNFEIKTDDPNNQDFPITLTYPLGNGISRFVVSLKSPHEDQLGELYYLGPIQPIIVDLINTDNEVILPDTSLENETYIVLSGGETVQSKPGDKIKLSLSSGPLEVQLLDKYGFVRGLTSAIPINIPPITSFGFIFSDTDNQKTVQFTDASSDPDGQITEWFWNFGDGSASNEKDPQHTYDQGGSYTVSLTIVDDGNNKDTQIEKIQVGVNPLPAKQNSLNGKDLFLLIGGGVLLGISLVIILAFCQKKKREYQQINEKSNLEMKPGSSKITNPRSINKHPIKTGIIVLGVVIILAILIGVFNERLIELISGFKNSTASMNGTSVDSPINKDSTKISEIDGMTLLFVPSGEFLMGSPGGVGEPNEQPQHVVNLSSYWIDQTEVTNLMYKKCVEEEGCTKPSLDYYYLNEDFEDSPVTSIDWNQAKTYCEWSGRNLPTEAQWEKAARGTDGQIYPWGDNLPNSSLANFGNRGSDELTRENAGILGSLSPVYSYPQGVSPYKIYNMSGNAAEWVADWYGEYQGIPQNDPVSPEMGDYRVVRGGSTINNANYIRSAFRNKAKPTTQNSTIGFRCVMPAE